MRRASAPVLMCCLVALAGCASRPPPPGALLDAATARQVLESLEQFSFEGRAAATRGDAGSQASLSWNQQGPDSQLRLSGPLGMGATQVRIGGDTLSITTSRGEQLEGEAARSALEEQLGMTVPFASLRYWVLGLPAPGSEARQSLDETGRLAALSQQGWAVTFDEYRVQGAAQGQVSLPRRLTARRDELRLRLVIDRWKLLP